MSGGSSKKRDDDYPLPAKRDSYTSSSSKRDDYSSSKRSDDYGSSKRGDDYGSSSLKRSSTGGDFGAPSKSSRDYDKRDDDYKRDSYKRSSDYKRDHVNDLPSRSSGTGIGSSGYDNRGGGASLVVSHGGGGLHKDRGGYNDHSSSDRISGGVGTSRFSGGGGRSMQPSSGNLNNVTLIGGNPGGVGGSGGGISSIVMKDDRNTSRYNIGAPAQSDLRYGNDRMGTSPWMSNAGQSQGGGGGGVKQFSNMPQQQNDLWSKDNGWRSMDSGQDRYDRTYNERKSSPYMDQPRQSSSGQGGGSFISRPQDRYNNSVSSRFDNGRF